MLLLTKIRTCYLLAFITISVIIANTAYPKNVTITPENITLPIELKGRVNALDTYDISAATNANINEVYIQLGQKVQKDQELLLLKSDQLDIDIRNAKEILIKTQIDYNKKTAWKNSDEVFRAKQDNTKSKLNLQRANDIFSQNKILHKQGIISSNELEQSSIAYKDAKLSLELSDRHLKQVLNQGDDTQINLLELSLENAKARLQILEEIKDKLLIKSPIDGVILKPNNNTEKSNNSKSFLSLGYNASSNENLLAIGDFNGFAVTILADEKIVQNISLKQKVNIVIPALKDNNNFTGTITAIDAQPNNQDNKQEPPKYNITIKSFDNNIKEHNIFLGMTAKINFSLTEKNDALLIPFESINYDQDSLPYVEKLISNNKYIKTKVTLGHTTTNKIEVIAGLTSGDTIKS